MDETPNRGDRAAPSTPSVYRDPAELPLEQRPGVRVHVHEQNRLHGWVFLQDRVWVDYWGNEHQLESLTTEHVRNIISLCRRQAPRIELLAALELLHRLIDVDGFHGADRDDQELSRLINLVSAATAETDWLETTPLILALHRRLLNAEERP